MARPKSLLKEEVPETVIGEIAKYLASTCGVPGCSAVFHMDDAQAIAKIIVEYNNKRRESK